MAVQQDLPIPVPEAEGQGASVQVDATIKLVLLGVKSPEVSSSSLVFSLLPAYHGGMWRGGLNKYQGAAADACQPPLVPRCGCQARLRPGVDMTSNVKSGLPIVLHFLRPLVLCPSEEPEPVRDDG